MAVSVAVALSSCSSEPDITLSDWEEPAWFAEQAREQETVAAILDDCMESKGWDLTIGPRGDIAESLAELPDPQRPIEDIQVCFGEIPSDYRVALDEEYLRDTLYPREVDVHACLLAHGATPEQPQPIDLFIEGYLGDDPALEPWTAWSPAVMAQYAEEHGDEALEVLEGACPQPYAAPQPQ